jgi:hypothetical protein
MSLACRQARTVASERQLIGIVNVDDGFQAVSSQDRLSSLDPLLPLSAPRSGHCLLGVHAHPRASMS